MFEKEVEEYREKEKKKGYYWVTQEMEQSELDTIIDESFRDGATFGYNKANEWQKDLPTEDIRLAIIEIEDCGYLLCNYRNGFWYEDNSGAICAEWITNNIVRWKEIVLPELPEEIEEK